MVVRIVVAALLLTACQTTTSVQTIKGSGSIVLQERNVTGFTGVQVNISGDLTLIRGDGEALTIEGDDNLMQYIRTDVQNSKLVIDTPNNTSISPSRPFKLTVTYSSLRSIDIWGKSTVTADGLDLPALDITFTGSGSARLTGKADTQTISISGSSIVNNFDLTSRTVNVDIKGMGTVEVTATESLNITVAGNGNIRYAGNPTITRNVAGSATITPRQ
jgi:hypothetical protein